MRPITGLVRAAALALSFLAISGRADEIDFVVVPAAIQLGGDFERAQLVVRQVDDGQVKADSSDLTSKASYRSSNDKVVRVRAGGQLVATGNGRASISVSVGQRQHEIPVQVSGCGREQHASYMGHVRPLLSKLGCAAAACHASQHGKGGFKLSVFGYDPLADFRAMARQSRQRRVNFARPAASLLIRKPTMAMPHGGGRVLKVGSLEYQMLLTWIKTGAAQPERKAPTVQRLTVTPSLRVGQPGMKQQMRVVAQLSDGSSRDVTAFAKYDAIDTGVVVVQPDGQVTAAGKGQTAVMVRFEGQAEICRFVIPYSSEASLSNWKSNNFIDELAAAKFKELGLEPSQLCDDTTFIRRAFLDAVGSLPPQQEVATFLASKAADKRNKLIDQLLGLTGDPKLDIYNDRYAAFWTLKWSDLIRNNSNSLGEQGMWALHNWIRESFRVNKPFDQFVQQLVTAKGSIYSNGPANYFRINSNSSALTESTAQLFLGIRLECAKCHHHPFEKYSQADYYGLAAFFSRVGSKGSEEFGLFGREQVIVVRSSGDVRHPRTGKLMQPTPLEGTPAAKSLDRRIPLAAWLTSPKNEFFAKSVVNRYMGYLLGRGLVEPIDDMRSTNPPSNVPLMNALSEEFAKSGFDLKQLMRTIMTSRLYQLSSEPNRHNARDRRFYSHYYVKRLAAEPLLDAIDQATGVQTKFKSLPIGTRAIELPDAEYPNYFLKTFAKPRRASVCECERSPDESLAQALHTLNGETLANKIAHKNGRLAKLLKEKRPHDQMVREIYLATLCRPPSKPEVEASRQFLKLSPNAKEHYEDLVWALINSKQFLFVY